MDKPREQDGYRWPLGLAVFWAAALAFCLRTLTLLDDHYGRISPGRQILVYGELPFRDFLDPGYFLTEFSSAAVQWLFGQNLLGELLLDSLFITTGCLFVCVVTRRLTGSMAAAFAAGATALLTLPRAYDYDKVLFYPFGIWVAWRWLEQPRPGRLAACAVTLSVASLYRYDNGVFLGLAALVGLVSICWRNPRDLLIRASVLAVATIGVSIPAIVFVQTHGGLANALDQSLTYGVRERDRTRITSAPRVHIGTRIVAVNPSPSSQNVVTVRWSPAIASADQRRDAARRLGLDVEQTIGPPERRTWQYVLADASGERIRQLVNDPMVEDTDGIDRSNLVLLHPESWLLRIQRLSPLLRVRVFPDAWTFENAQASVYYLCVLLPIVSAVLLAWRWPVEEQVGRGAIALLIALCVLLDVFILRDPINARVGGIAGPVAILAFWVGVHLAYGARRLPSRGARVGAGSVFAGVALLLVWSVGSTAEWSRQLEEPASAPAAITARLRRFATIPPPLELLPSGRTETIVRYVQRCTQPTDRVFTSWFLPQLFYFAQRGFGGGISATFGSHWSEPRFQARAIAALEAQPTPLVLLRAASYEQFRADYPLLDAFIGRWYRVAGATNFGDADAGSDAYRVLVRADRLVSSVDQTTGLPCFSG